MCPAFPASIIRVALAKSILHLDLVLLDEATEDLEPIVPLDAELRLEPEPALDPFDERCGMVIRPLDPELV